MPWKLLWRNVLGHPVRSLLTVGAVAVAFVAQVAKHVVELAFAQTICLLFQAR